MRSSFDLYIQTNQELRYCALTGETFLCRGAPAREGGSAHDKLIERSVQRPAGDENASFRKRHHGFYFTFFNSGVVAHAFENGGFGPSDNRSDKAGLFKGALFCEKQVQVG